MIPATMTTILQDRLAAKPGPVDGSAPSLAHALVEQLLISAAKGDIDALRLIWERSEGPTVMPPKPKSPPKPRSTAKNASASDGPGA